MASRRFLLPAFVSLLFFALAPAHAAASFGLLPGSEGFAVSMTRDGQPISRAGAHPDQMQVHIALATNGAHTDGDLRDLRLDLPAGMLANPAALDECDRAQFSTPRTSPYGASLSGESCPLASQVGLVAVHLAGIGTRTFGVFNLTAPYGSAEALGFAPYGVPIVLRGALRDSDHGLSFALTDLSQARDIEAIDLTLWGTPWDYHHDTQRGNCLNESDPAAYHGEPSYWDEEVVPPVFHPGSCHVLLSAPSPISPLGAVTKSYLTLPTTCGEQMRWALRVSAWQQAGADEASATSSQPVFDCLEVLTRVRAQLRTDRAAAATGIVFHLDVEDGGGFTNVDGRIRSPIRRATALLPPGLTINPSLGAGLGVCTEAQFALETATSPPGSGCPNDSKIGEVSADGFLGLPEQLSGSIFLAKPYANPSGSLIALYITLASPRRGLFFTSFGTLEPDPSGRLTATFDQLPPLHYDHFTLSLREGQRAATISPPTCGTYHTGFQYIPWSDPGLLLHDSSEFIIDRGEDGGACPAGGRPFTPALEAGSTNPTAGFFSPFQLRMTRTDADQEITSYSATFPPGLLARLAGLSECPEAALAAASARSGPRGGEEELADPSCPASSEIGHTLTGYGVGGTLAYAPGGLYLAGPYHGAPLSTVAIDSALVGPFDLGVVLVRSAIRIDPRTAQASIDSSGSDPIPHILKGIPLDLRDIRVAIDRPDFTLNPTSCDPLATLSTLTGSGGDSFNPADDLSTTATSRFQLSDCSGFQFKPKLRLSLTGGTKRGDFPALRATYLPRAADPNLKQAVVTLPNSIFFAQEHIGEICTRPRFRAGTCPPASRLGHARATTPLLDEPFTGPVYVRANPGQELPEIVASLSARGFLLEVVGRIDRGRGGGMRASFETLPDAPVTSFTMRLAGGEKSLLVNSDDLCLVKKPALGKFVAHDNATALLHPRLRVRCGGDHQHHRGKR